MKSDHGTYTLVLRSDTRTPVQIGRWGILDVCPGYYIYVGSAFGPGGVLARVSRHCRTIKSKHWHIDYLREFTVPTSAWCSYGPVCFEHDWAEALTGMTDITPVKGFGCSDCKCDTHLFFAPDETALTACANAVQGRVELWSCELAVWRCKENRTR